MCMKNIHNYYYGNENQKKEISHNRDDTQTII